MEKDWLFSAEDCICSVRTAGVLVRDGKILVQREANGNEYALPGGHIKLGETSEAGLIREFREETGAVIRCQRLLWSEECFWNWNGKQAHNITFYYLIALDTGSDIPDTGEFISHKDNCKVVLGWLPVEALESITVYPGFLKTEIFHLDAPIKHFITKDQVKDMTRVYFVRHARSDWRSGSDRERGLTADALEDRKIVLDFLRDKQVDIFYCSPYRRSLDTIRETAEFYGKPILTDERLREREAAPNGNCRKLFRKRWADFDWHEPGGETLRSVQERNMAALTEILRQNEGKNIVIGTHGTALSTILNYYDPSYNCDSFLRIIDWMPFVVELDFDGTQFLSKTEHVHVEKRFKQ